MDALMVSRSYCGVGGLVEVGVFVFRCVARLAACLYEALSSRSACVHVCSGGYIYENRGSSTESGRGRVR